LRKTAPDVDYRQASFYSFWFYDCVYLAWLKKKKTINKAIARAHSGDLYEDHVSIRDKTLMRGFVLSNLDYVLPVSDVGSNYLQSKYPENAVKVKTVRLGTDDYGLNAFSKESTFTIVSCANFRHHKRIHVIAEVLTRADFPLKWYHIGNEGEGTNDPMVPVFIANKAVLGKNENVNYISMGTLDNEEVMKFYQEQSVNLFVSLSEVEGLPVSMMEAISMGIPVLSTDVGGCREIVTEETGVLIEADLPADKVWNVIRDFKETSKNEDSFRLGVREFWLNNFAASSNYEEFIKILKS